jgi:hypothetical protein
MTELTEARLMPSLVALAARLSLQSLLRTCWDMCRTLSHDPLALDPNCIHIVDAQVFAGSTYHLVASDDNDFNALLPAWGIREAYMGPGNTLAEVSVLCLICNAIHECWGFVPEIAP